ncbi:MAG: dihydropteroate synthase [Candidatus Binatia bacterium]
MERRTAVMGILNITPDSFFDGGKYLDPARAVARGVELACSGADVIDIGGESSRPGARPVSVQEEMERVLPIIRGLRQAVAIPISIDTYKAEVARAALDEGADIVNDISALRFDPGMVSLVAEKKTPVILMHMQGKPQTMQEKPYYQNVLDEVKNFLLDRMRFAAKRGVEPKQIIIDPGIGFGKNLDHNLTLLRDLSSLDVLGRPLLVGPSRKTFIGEILEVGPGDRLEGSLAATVAAVLRGANMIRIHDVKTACRAIRVADALRFGMSESKGRQDA